MPAELIQSAVLIRRPLMHEIKLLPHIENDAGWLFSGLAVQRLQPALARRLAGGGAAVTFFHAMARALFMVVASAAGRWIIV